MQGYYFHTDNPYKDWPNAFEEGLRKARDGDLPNAVLLLEAAILQDPQDSEVTGQVDQKELRLFYPSVLAGTLTAMLVYHQTLI